MSSPEEIRTKRLARLAALQAQSQAQNQTQSKPKQPESRPEPTSNQPKHQKTAPSQLPKVPVGKLAAAPVQPTVRAPKKVDMGEWTNGTLERILGVTMDSTKAKKDGLICLETEDSPDMAYRLSFEMIDPALLEVLTEKGTGPQYSGSPMNYLYTVWRRANDAKRIVRSDDPDRADKLRLLNEVLRLSSSYASILFQIPDMFVDPVDTEHAIDDLWMDIARRDTFLMDIIVRAVENDSVLDLLNAVIPPLTQRLATLDYRAGDVDYSKILTTIQIFLDNKAIAQQFHEVDGYHPDGLKGPDFEKATILGRILRLSPLLPEIAEQNYPAGITKQLAIKTHESLQQEHIVIVGRLFDICNRLVRAGGPARQHFLAWLADVVNKNHLRRGEHARPEKIASDSLMLNLTLILERFAQPFLTGPLDKLDKIDPRYLNHKNKLIDLTEETKINSTIEEYNSYYTDDKLIETPLNFISECFFLLLTYLQYGLGGVYVSFDRLGNYVKQMSQQLHQFEEMMARNSQAAASNPMIQRMMQSKIEPMKRQLAKFKAQRLSIEMVFYHRNLQLEIFEVIVGAITYFMRMIDPQHEYPNKQIRLPLHDYENNDEEMDDIEATRKLAPVPFKYYPEIFLEGIINYCHYVSKFNNNPMFQNEDKLNRFVEFAVAILRCPELVSNPHLKARLTEVLFFGSLPLTNDHDGYMIDVFNNNTTVKKNLMVSLLDFYVVVEKTGSSSQFYDKFNARYHISYILEQLWKFDYFRQDLKRISEHMPKLFIRLIARMLNDTTYLLDESLNHLHTIGACQREMDNREKGKQHTMEESDKDLQKKLEESERMAKSFVQLSNKTVKLFNLFTKETPRSFVIEEIVGRLAGMLDYNLMALVGPRYNELKVKNPEQYKFDPGELLFQLCSIFINLGDQPEFVEAVAKDDRSFDEECFKKAVRILYKVGKVPSADYEKKLLAFAHNAAETRRAEEEEEEELGEIPDEFADPLMFTLMKDPVKLPHSKISMDRAVLKAHLMNDQNDPFNRTPLKLEDVTEDTELKQRINDWVRGRKAEIRKEKESAAANSGDADGDVTMAQ